MIPLLPPSRRLADRRHLWPGVAAFVAAIAVALVGLYARADAPAPTPAPQQVKLRLLGVNDFHGHLEPPKPGLGGAAWLAAHLDRATLPGHTIRVHGGDMVGASPLISSWFHDEPAIEATNAMGFDLGTPGNHEFDEGGDELMRLVHGGRRSGPEALKRNAAGQIVNTSSPGFKGASYPYISANTFDRDGRPLLPPYRVIERAGVRVGFIGVVTTTTPQYVLPRHAERFRFTDLSDAVNRWVPVLRRQGVEAIVVLAHEGAPTPPAMDSSRAQGAVVDETRQMSGAVDVVIAGHSHSALNLRVPGAEGADKLIVQARSFGKAFDQVDMTIDRGSGDVVSKSAQVLPTPHAGIEPDARVAALVERYAKRVAPLAGHVVGSAQEPLTRANGKLADKAAAAQRRLAGTQLAIANGGSLRGDIDAGPITYSEVAEAQGYDHPVMRMTMRGAEVLRVLATRGQNMHLAGSRGGALDPGARYTVAANELLAETNPLLRASGKGKRPVGTEAQALAAWLERARR